MILHGFTGGFFLLLLVLHTLPQHRMETWPLISDSRWWMVPSTKQHSISLKLQLIANVCKTVRQNISFICKLYFFWFRIVLLAFKLISSCLFTVLCKYVRNKTRQGTLKKNKQCYVMGESPWRRMHV